MKNQVGQLPRRITATHAIIFLFVVVCIVQGEIPVFNYTGREMNEELYDREMLFAAAESCGVDTGIDYVELYENRKFVLVKVLDWKDSFGILRKRVVDARWENGRLLTYGCKGEAYDTVYRVGRPPYRLHVKHVEKEKEIADVYECVRRHLNENGKSDFAIWTINKLEKNWYEVDVGNELGYDKYEVRRQKKKFVVEKTGHWKF